MIGKQSAWHPRKIWQQNAGLDSWGCKHQYDSFYQVFHFSFYWQLLSTLKCFYPAAAWIGDELASSAKRFTTLPIFKLVNPLFDDWTWIWIWQLSNHVRRRVGRIATGDQSYFRLAWLLPHGVFGISIWFSKRFMPCMDRSFLLISRDNYFRFINLVFLSLDDVSLWMYFSTTVSVGSAGQWKPAALLFIQHAKLA